MSADSTLPRRTSRLRTMAAGMGAQMATKTLAQANARQAVSDRIGYLLAFVAGAVVFRYGGERGATAVAAIYVVSAWLAYRRWRKVSA